MRKAVAALFCCIALAACGQDEGADIPGPTPREVLFGVSMPKHLRLSPDGDWVSFSQAIGGVRNIWLKPATRDEPAVPLTTFEHPGVGPHVWHPSGNYIAFLRQTPGSDDVRPYVYDLKQKKIRGLFGAVGQQASFLSFAAGSEDAVYIQSNTRAPRQRDIYKVDLLSGASLLVYQDTFGASGYVAGPDLNPLIAQVPRGDGGFEWRIRTAQGAWRLWGSVGAEDALTTRLEGVSQDGQDVFMASSIGRDTTAFLRAAVAKRFEDSNLEVLAAQDGYDFADASYSPITGQPFVAMFATPRPSLLPLDKRLIPLVFGMRASDSGALVVADADVQARRWLIGHVTGSEPTKWGVFNSETTRKTPLFPEQSAFMEQQAAILPEVVRIPVGEADSLDAFLSLPLGTQRAPNGALLAPVPVALILRGALASRDEWGYSRVHQWLASRGVGVLSINHRGSAGQGKDHLYPRQGLSEAIVEDVSTAAAWLKQQNIMGEKFAILAGGASTQAAITLANEPAASCLALTFPVFSMSRALGTLAPQQSGLAKLLKASFSAELDGAAYPSAPTFLVAAGEYRREKIEDVFSWSAKAKQAGTPLTLVALPRAETRFDSGADGRAVMAAMEMFLSDCLGFAPEPLDYSDFKNAQISVLEGSADFVQQIKTVQSPPAD
ncbi:MAG: prolyl oligopeptidase family serine peptidase [Pseudomonadota bacterium]